MSTDHNFWSERRAEADSNRGPSAYQPNALPLGQTGSRIIATDGGLRPWLTPAQPAALCLNRSAKVVRWGGQQRTDWLRGTEWSTRHTKQGEEVKTRLPRMQRVSIPAAIMGRNAERSKTLHDVVYQTRWESGKVDLPAAIITVNSSSTEWSTPHTKQRSGGNPDHSWSDYYGYNVVFCCGEYHR